MPSATGASASAMASGSTPRAAAAASSPMPGAATPASAAATPGLFASHLQAPSASAPGSTAPSPRPASSSSVNAAGEQGSSSKGISVQATSIPSVALNAVAASAAAAAASASAPSASSSTTSAAAAAEALQDPALFPTLLPKMNVLLTLLSEAGHKTASLWEAPPDGASAPAPIIAPLPAPSTGGGLALGSSADDELAYSLVSHLEASAERANRKPTPLNDAIVKASQQLASTYNAARSAIRALGEGADMPLGEIRELEGTLERYEGRLKALGTGQEGSGGDSVMT